MLLSEMTEMTRFPRHCYSVTAAVGSVYSVNMFFSVDDKVLLKRLYQFTGRLVQTFN